MTQWLGAKTLTPTMASGYKSGTNPRTPVVTAQVPKRFHEAFRRGIVAAIIAVCVGDYNNDGFEDIFCTYFGQNILYRNNGDGTFTDVTKAAAGPAVASPKASPRSPEPVHRLAQGR